MLGPRATVVIASVVTAVWALNFLAGLVLKSYHPDQTINGIFMAVVGGLMALGNHGGGRHKGKHSKSKREEEDEDR